MLIKDLTGQEFERLTVIGLFPERSKNGKTLWICSCSCYNFALVSRDCLVFKKTKSCGCLHKEKSSERFLAIPPSKRTEIARKGGKIAGKLTGKANGSAKRALQRRADGLSIRRIAKSLSVQEAAARIGCSSGFVGQVEQGRKRFGKKCNGIAAREIYGDLTKFRKQGSSKKVHQCVVCNSIFEGCGKQDRRCKSPTFNKRHDLCSDKCLKRWYAGERFKAPLPTPLMDAPKPPKERKRDREKAQISAVVKENIARKAVT